MKLNKKSITIGAAIVVVALVAWKVFSTPKSPITYETQAAERGEISQTVEATGEVVSSEDVELTFEVPGRLKTITATVGARVEAGDVLAMLDDRDSGLALQRAKAALSTAQSNLEKILSGATSQEIRVAEVAFNNAERTLESHRQNLQGTIASNEASLSKAYADLDGTVETLYLRSVSAFQTLQNDVFDAAGNRRNDFSTSDAAAASKATADFQSAKTAREAMEPAILSYRSSDDAAKNAIVNGFLDHARVIRDASASANLMMQLSSPTGATTQATFDTRKANVKSAWSDMNSGLNAAESQLSAVAATKAANASALRAAEKAVSDAEGARAAALAALELKKAPATAPDVSAARASVESAKAAVSEAEVALDKTALRAPFDGMIAQVTGKVGRTVTGADAIMKIHGQNLYEVEADIAETDVAKLKPGVKAWVTFDAYGNDARFEGELVTVDTAETVIQDIVYYRGRFRIQAPDDKPLRSGMSADLDIVTAQAKDVIIVPQRAIRQNGDGKKYVRLLEAGAEVRRDVKTGLVGDEGRVEIVEGLSGGEQVIIAVREDGKLKSE
jgi:HlyD family secretion protein